MSPGIKFNFGCCFCTTQLLGYQLVFLQEKDIRDCMPEFDCVVANLDSVILPLKKMRAAKLNPKPKATGKPKSKAKSKAPAA